jgi:hypothetical protein
LDEIKFLPNRNCPQINEHGSLVTHTCDFEDPLLCNYGLDASVNGIWERKSPDPLSFPSIDNTYQTSAGHFMSYKVCLVYILFFAESFFVYLFKKSSNQVARLLTPNFSSANTGFCLEFFYYA